MKITKKMLAIAGLCIICIFVAVMFTMNGTKKAKNKANVTLTQEIVDDASNTNILNEKTTTNKNESTTNNSIVQEDKKESNDSKTINSNISTNQNDSITTNNKMENDKTDNVNSSDNSQNSNNDKNYVETYVASEYELPTVFFD